MSIVTFSGPGGQNADIKNIKEGLESTPAVTATRGTAWIAEGKLNYRNDPTLKAKDPGTFKLYAHPPAQKLSQETFAFDRRQCRTGHTVLLG